MQGSDSKSGVRWLNRRKKTAVEDCSPPNHNWLCAAQLRSKFVCDWWKKNTNIRSNVKICTQDQHYNKIELFVFPLDEQMLFSESILAQCIWQSALLSALEPVFTQTLWANHFPTLRRWMLRVCWEDVAILDLSADSHPPSPSDFLTPPSPSAPPALVQAPKIAYQSANGPKAKSKHAKS